MTQSNTKTSRYFLAIVLFIILAAGTTTAAESKHAAPSLILHNGKIVTVDDRFHVAEAMAVRGKRIAAVGGNEEVLKLAGPNTEKIDLGGKTVLPGLIDSHSHPYNASLYEFDHKVPNMETVEEVLDYVKSRAAVLKPGQWISVKQVFITRLRDRRFPTREELDCAAPNNPAWFATGPDASLNTLALKASGIDKNFKITDGQAGSVERDPATGEPTGILRNCKRFVKYEPTAKTPDAKERIRCLRDMMASYNRLGITSVVDREAHARHIECYQALKDSDELSCRIFLTYYIDAQLPWKQIEERIQKAARHPLHKYDNMLWLRGIKIYIDGGMLTGSAYMVRPWGESKIYSITDPKYRGLLFVEPERLYRIAREVLANDLQLTAHCVGDGAFNTLVGAYERVNREFPVRPKRPCISHGNFMTPESIGKMCDLGVVADLQPVWLYMDGKTLLAHFGEERLKYFQPYKTLQEQGVVVGGGSDHMQKQGRRRSINSYDPWLGMWTTLVRRPRWTDESLHIEQGIDRKQAIRLYTINNAYLTFEEKEKGSLEPGKLADFIVIDRDVLTCPVEDVKDTVVLSTYLGGKRVHAAEGE